MQSYLKIVFLNKLKLFKTLMNKKNLTRVVCRFCGAVAFGIFFHFITGQIAKIQTLIYVQILTVRLTVLHDDFFVKNFCVRFIYQLNKKNNMKNNFCWQPCVFTVLLRLNMTSPRSSARNFTEITGFLLSQLTRTENSPPAFEKTPAGVRSRDTNWPIRF